MRKNPSCEQQLFDMISAMGECLEGDLHIFDNTDVAENAGRFRVYHTLGYCFDVERVHGPKEGTYEYSFFAEWPEFATLSVVNAVQLIREHQIKNAR